MHRFPIIHYISIVDYFLAFKYWGQTFSVVSRHIVGSVCVMCSLCKNVNILMCVQLGKENPYKCWKESVFTENLKAEYLFISKDQHAGKVFSTICKSLFSIEHGGRSNILQHKKKIFIAVSNMSCSQKVTSYFTKETVTFHTIKHNHSFPSMDCTSSVIRNLHIQKFSCGWTKCEAVVVNVLAPFAMQQILEELETVKYISVMVDTSNHKSLKLVPL
jgi:hypothetical protein